LPVSPGHEARRSAEDQVKQHTADDRGDRPAPIRRRLTAGRSRCESGAGTPDCLAASMALASRLGLPTETLVDALDGSPIVSPWQAAKLRRIAQGEYSAQFALSLALKDVHLALQASVDDQLAVLACLADEWQRVVDSGLGDQDLTLVTRVLEQLGGRQDMA
jgi:hypothetical protein